MKGNKVGWLARLGACLGLSAFALSANAEYVQCETSFSQGISLQSIAQATADGLPNLTQIVWGSSLSVSSFDVSGAGQLSIELEDIEWPTALSELTLLVTDLNDVWQQLDVTDGIGNLLLDVASAGQFFVAVYARTEGDEPGLYHLSASFAPVPLPAAAWLLLSGLVAVGATARKRRQ